LANIDDLHTSDGLVHGLITAVRNDSALKIDSVGFKAKISVQIFLAWILQVTGADINGRSEKTGVKSLSGIHGIAQIVITSIVDNVTAVNNSVRVVAESTGRICRSRIDNLAKAP